MSLPTWAKPPVIGAMKPMLRSSASAGAAAKDSAVPNSNTVREILIIHPPELKARHPFLAWMDEAGATFPDAITVSSPFERRKPARPQDVPYFPAGRARFQRLKLGGALIAV